MRKMKRSMKSTWVKRMKVEHIYFFNNFTIVVDSIGGKMTFIKN